MACGDCLAGRLEWPLAVERERKPLTRATDRRADLREVTITVQPGDREAA
jgi:hypothetical protein